VLTAWLSLLAWLWPAGVAAQTAVEYYHLDALGTVRAVTNASGQVVRRHDVMPFGEEVSPTVPNPDKQLFTGHERDAETSLDYFGARYYRADVGRFTTVDPVYTWTENLVDPQRWNRYSYVRNNPLKYVDPDGRYTSGCASSDGACVGVQQRFEAARQADLKSKDPLVRAAASAYGDFGEDNGVLVSFQRTGYDGYVRVDGRTLGTAQVSVWISPDAVGLDLQQLVAHEGSHVSDALAFITTRFDERVNPTTIETETRAFEIGARVKPYDQATTCGGAPCRRQFGPDAAAIREFLKRDDAYRARITKKVY
jgi:RHS repeat-associated protein